MEYTLESPSLPGPEGAGGRRDGRCRRDGRKEYGVDAEVVGGAEVLVADALLVGIFLPGIRLVRASVGNAVLVGQAHHGVVVMMGDERDEQHHQHRQQDRQD